MTSVTATAVRRKKHSIWQRAWFQRNLVIMTIPGIVLLLVFNYLPMYGILISFKTYSPRAGIWGSEWVGLKYYEQFFQNPLMPKLLKNTFLLGIYSLLWSFPAPIVFALALNELRNRKFQRTMQTISYFPYFISTVIVCGMVKEFASRNGLFNQIGALFGMAPRSFFLDPKYFRTLFIGSGIWQTVGFDSIIYLAALTGVNADLLDAADIDGANRFQRIWYINWPAIIPTTTVLLILKMSQVLGNDFTKIILLYTPQTYSTADVINTYIFREGIQGQRFEYATAIGLFMSLMSFGIIVVSNWISRRVSGESLW